MSKEIEINSEILEVLYDSLIPIHYKLESILESIFEKSVVISEPERAILLEFVAYSSALKLMFEDIIEKSGKSENILIPQEQYYSIIKMSKSVEMASRACFGPFAMWAH